MTPTSADPQAAPLLELDAVTFRYRGAPTPALSEVSLEVRGGSSLGIVGESGSGKTTILSLLLGLRTPDQGEVRFRGSALKGRAAIASLRRDVQPVFQDPYSSLDPRMRIDRIIAEPLLSLGVETDPGRRRTRVRSVLAEVGLPDEVMTRYPHEFSGGQRQRIAIARALVTDPQVLIADEPVSALDVTTRVEVISLLARLQTERSLSVVMVSHDLSVVAALCDQTVVLKDGAVAERGSTLHLIKEPRQPYTQSLIAAIPRLPGDT